MRPKFQLALYIYLGELSDSAFRVGTVACTYLKKKLYYNFHVKRPLEPGILLIFIFITILNLIL